MTDPIDWHVWLVPTPIGNLKDITLRALEVLQSVDAIAAEDTRRSRVLLDHFAIKKPILRLDAHTMHKAESILTQYPKLAYITDAGTPGISDPGHELVAIVREFGGKIEVLPGANALLPALILSNFPLESFAFFGFLAKKGSKRKQLIEQIAKSEHTTAIYESPNRLLDTILELIDICGSERKCAVVREISKIHEEVFIGSLIEAKNHFLQVKGEIVLVISPNESQEKVDFTLKTEQLWQEGLRGKALRDELVSLGLERNKAYDLVLAIEKQTKQNH